MSAIPWLEIETGIPITSLGCQLKSPSVRQNASEHRRRGSRSGSRRRPTPPFIGLPRSRIFDEELAPVSSPRSHDARPSFRNSISTPVESPDESCGAFWGRGEGSVVSSASSTDSKEKIALLKRKARLERPFIGRPTDNKERCMSVSLIVGSDGVAQVKKEEVEVEFLESQKNLAPVSGAVSLMHRMVSSAGSDTSVSKNFNNLSLVNSTLGEVLVRSASQQTDLSHSIPLTPLSGQFPQFVSPKHLRTDSASMTRSGSLLRTPETVLWSDSEDEQDPDELGTGNAQIEVKRLYDKKLGTVAKGFMGSSMPLSPMAPARLSSQMVCSACQIVFKSKDALASHTLRCSVKQTPFVSTDFFESLDMFNMSSDALFISHFSQAGDMPTLPLGSLLEAGFENHDDRIFGTSPRKRLRLNKMASIPTTPTRTKNHETHTRHTTK